MLLNQCDQVCDPVSIVVSVQFSQSNVIINVFIVSGVTG